MLTERGLQRPAQDARGAAGQRRVRAGHDRAAQDPDDHRLALPALRLPPAAGARHRATARPASWSARTLARSTSVAGRASTSRRPPDEIARHSQGGFRDAIGTLDKLVDLLAEGAIAPADVLEALGVTDADLLFEITDIVIERPRPRRCSSCSDWPTTAPTTRSSSATCCATCARSSSLQHLEDAARRPRPLRALGQTVELDEQSSPLLPQAKSSRPARSSTSSSSSARRSARSATAWTRGCSSSWRSSRRRGRSWTTRPPLSRSACGASRPAVSRSRRRRPRRSAGARPEPPHPTAARSSRVAAAVAAHTAPAGTRKGRGARARRRAAPPRTASPRRRGVADAPIADGPTETPAAQAPAADAEAAQAIAAGGDPDQAASDAEKPGGAMPTSPGGRRRGARGRRHPRQARLAARPAKQAEAQSVGLYAVIKDARVRAAGERLVLGLPSESRAQ